MCKALQLLYSSTALLHSSPVLLYSSTALLYSSTAAYVQAGGRLHGHCSMCHSNKCTPFTAAVSTIQRPRPRSPRHSPASPSTPPPFPAPTQPRRPPGNVPRVGKTDRHTDDRRCCVVHSFHSQAGNYACGPSRPKQRAQAVYTVCAHACSQGTDRLHPHKAPRQQQHAACVHTAACHSARRKSICVTPHRVSVTHGAVRCL